MSNGNTPSDALKPSMQTLNEEDIVSEPIPLPPPPNFETIPIDQTDHLNVIDVKSTGLSNGSNEKSERQTKEKNCTERSDSGFSDCSSSSNGHSNVVAHVTNLVAVAHPLFDKVNSISEEKTNEQSQRENAIDNVKEFGGKISVNMLKLKLEKIAEAQQDSKSSNNSNRKVMRKLSTPFAVETVNQCEDAYVEQKHETSQIRTSYSFEFDDMDLMKDANNEPKSLPAKSIPKALMRSASLHHKRIVEKEPIMKSDFTNTVKMRKKSLESNATREKQIHSPRILLEPSGKVSKLLRRFDSQNSTANGSLSDISVTDASVNRNGYRTLNVEDTLKDIEPKNRSKIETSMADDEVFEILSTPMAAANHKSPSSKRKSPTKVTKSHVSNGSMKRTFATKHEYTNTKTCVTSMEVKVSQRQSPTKFANTASNASPINRATPKAILNQTKQTNVLKKSHKSTTADASMGTSTATTAAAATVQRASRNATIGNKTTAYSSFNRTSPVRLSGRVKEVTDRLSAPKAIVKAPSPVKDHHRFDMKMSNAKNALTQEHHQMAMKSMSGTIKHQIVTVAEAVIETQHHVEHTINGKIDGTFTLKSKMNENFRKASAFWKAT